LAPNAPEEEEWLKQTAFSARSALQQLQLQAKLIDSALTPNSALLRFAGNANLTVEQVLKKRSELLTTYGLNVNRPPRTRAVIVAVERPKLQIIDIRSLWSEWSRPRTLGVIKSSDRSARKSALPCSSHLVKTMLHTR
jgi:S-DNA-T family DNA segregation ATPase FtsK/SpoIIIE